MIKNFFHIAWRNLMKSKLFSLINIIGLSVGLTCCMLIGLYIHHEFSYDKQHKNAPRLYQLGTSFIREGGNEENINANSPAPMARMMQDVFPEIIRSTRIIKLFADDKTLLQYGSDEGERKTFYETKGYLADSTFFDLFTYDFKEGNPASALSAPLCIVLMEDIAQKLFGNEPAVGKVIRVSSSSNGDFEFTVTGVFRKPLKPSHIDARFFLSMRGGDVDRYISPHTSLASNNMFHTYFLLREDADAGKLEAKFKSFIDTYAAADLKAMGFYKRQFLTRVSDIHLRSEAKDNVSASGNLTYLYILGSIALFTLLIACINFMNLSTARSARRAAEVGVRKVLGAQKISLIRQFLFESVIMAVFAFLLALLFTFSLLPVFSSLSAKDLGFSWEAHGNLLAGFFLLSILTGLLAGVYPAFYLSSFQPIKVLKGRITNSLAAISFRKALVIFQFIISVMLIIASAVINNQMNYMREKDLGFEKEQQVLIPLRSALAKSLYKPLKSRLEAQSGVSSVGASFYYPGIFNPSDMPLYREGGSMELSKKVVMNYVDEDFLQTIGIQPLAGRVFSRDFPADTNFRMVLNEEAIRELGYKDAQEATNKTVLIDWGGETYRFEIVGVVKNFHFQDLHSPIEPYGFQMIIDGSYNYIIAHTAHESLSATLRQMELHWRELNPQEPFEYSFLDESFEANHAADDRLSSIVKNFTIIAIFISCLGLFGLATFSAEQRTKEIGIRKVLGSSVAGIVTLLSKDFLKLVIIAIIIGSPFAALIMQEWLKDFAYRTQIGWEVFAITAIVAICIAMLTISVQAIKAALSNPVNSLRSGE